MASQAALCFRTWRTVWAVSPAAEKVIGEKAVQAPLTRIPVPRVVPHPMTGMINAAASISRFAQRSLVRSKLLFFRCEAADPPLGPRKQCRAKQSQRGPNDR